MALDALGRFVPSVPSWLKLLGTARSQYRSRVPSVPSVPSEKINDRKQNARLAWGFRI